MTADRRLSEADYSASAAPRCRRTAARRRVAGVSLAVTVYRGGCTSGMSPEPGKGSRSGQSSVWFVYYPSWFAWQGPIFYVVFLFRLAAIKRDRWKKQITSTCWCLDGQTELFPLISYWRARSGYLESKKQLVFINRAHVYLAVSCEIN